MHARFAGTCKVTGRPYAAGARIFNVDGFGWAINDANTRGALAEAPAATIRLKQGSDHMPGGLAGSGFRTGDLVLTRNCVPVVIVTAQAHFYDEDGLCFGVGRDRGWVVACTARPGRPEEVEEFAEAIESWASLGGPHAHLRLASATGLVAAAA